MGEKITTEGNWSGTASVTDVVAEEGKKPYFLMLLVDDKTDGASWNRAYFNTDSRACEITVEMFRELGVKGETTKEVLTNARTLTNAPCVWSTKRSQVGDYLNATWIKSCRCKASAQDVTNILDNIFGDDDLPF